MVCLRSVECFWLSLVLKVLTFTAATAVILWHIVKVDEHKQKAKRAAAARGISSSKTILPISLIDRLAIDGGAVVSIVMNAFYIVAELVVVLKSGAGGRSNCTLVAQLLINSWLSAKVALYIVCVGRVSAAFGNTPLAYSKRLIKVMYCILIAYYLVGVTLVVLLVEPETVHTGINSTGENADGEKDEMTVCAIRASLSIVALAVVGLFDFICAPVLTYMFISRVKQLLSQTVEVTTNVQDIELHFLPLKSALLVTVSVMTTVFALLASRISGFSIGYFDCLVNMTCLLLMRAEWTSTYWLVCGPLLACVARNSTVFSENSRINLVFIMKHFKGEHEQSNLTIGPQIMSRDVNSLKLSGGDATK